MRAWINVATWILFKADLCFSVRSFMYLFFLSCSHHHCPKWPHLILLTAYDLVNAKFMPFGMQTFGVRTTILVDTNLLWLFPCNFPMSLFLR